MSTLNQKNPGYHKIQLTENHPQGIKTEQTWQLCGLASNGTVFQTKLLFFPSFFLIGVQFLGNY